MQLADYTNQFLIFSVFALALNLLSGVAGQVSIAAGAFAGLGAFVAGYLAIHAHWAFLPTIIIVIPAGCLLGALMGLPALRLSNENVILLTLATQTAGIAVILAIPQLGGIYGLNGLPSVSVLHHTFLTPIDLLPLLSVIFLIVLAACAVVAYSRLGLVLRGIREDETATRSLGKNVFAYKVLVFSVTCGLIAFGGAIFAWYNAAAIPGQFDINLSIIIVVMVVIGGSGNLLGSLFGAAVIVASTPILENLVNLSESTTSLVRLIVYGGLLIAVIIIRPQGLVPEGVISQRRSRVLSSDMQAKSIETAVLTRVRDSGREFPEPQGERCLVDVVSVSKSFGGIQAVAGLSLRLNAGTITGLIGPNGAGKTTVFNLLTGAIKPDSGTVTLLGADVTGRSLDSIARSGMVRSFQDVRIFGRLTAAQNVLMGARDNAYALEQLNAVGMGSKAKTVASDLSFGEQKLVALARVLATDARVLLLDEPASGIDASWVERMIDIVLSIRRNDIAICVVEHNLQVVQRLASHVYFMENGRVTAQGPMDELSKNARLTEAYFGTAS
jgi:branched-chain amino acid transport system permease protein